MDEIIGLFVMSAGIIVLIILFSFAGAKVSRRGDEWEEKYWEDKK